MLLPEYLRNIEHKLRAYTVGSSNKKGVIALFTVSIISFFHEGVTYTESRAFMFPCILGFPVSIHGDSESGACMHVHMFLFILIYFCVFL